MKGVLICSALAILAIAGASHAQTPGVSESIDVVVSNVEVVVTDAKGEPVTGLRPEDFTITVNGTKHAVTNLSEYAGSTSRTYEDVAASHESTPSKVEVPSPREPVHLLILFDELVTPPSYKKRLVQSLHDGILASLTGDDEVMVVALTSREAVRTPFTRDMAAVKSTLDRVSRISDARAYLENDRRFLERDIAAASSEGEAKMFANAYAHMMQRRVRRRIFEIRESIRALSQLPGRRMILLVTERIPIHPGLEAFLLGDYGGTFQLQSSHYDMGKEFESLGNLAASNGVSIYTVQPTGWFASSMIGERSRVNDALQSAAMEAGVSMQLLAAKTGGEVLKGDNYSRSVTSLVKSLTHYYSLGYRPAKFNKGEIRRIAVRVNRPGVRVRSRTAAGIVSDTERMEGEVTGALVSDRMSNELGIAVSFSERKRRNRTEDFVQADIRVPMDKLVPRPDGNGYLASLAFHFVLMDGMGNLSSVVTREATVPIRSADVGSLAGKYYSYSAQLQVNASPVSVSVGVFDRNGNTSGVVRASLPGRSAPARDPVE